MDCYEGLDVLKAIDLICSHSSPSFRELVTLQDAVGRYAWDNVSSPIDYPPFPRSRMDGFACSSSSDFTKEFRVTGDISAAFRFDGEVLPNQCVRIATGAKVPDGSDLVVKFEDSNKTDSGVYLHRYSGDFQHIEPVGASLKQGQIVIHKSSKIDHRHIETLATLRINTVYVKGLRRVGILSTGSEITSTFSKHELVINSNYYALSSLLKLYGVPFASLGVCPDEKERLKNLITSGITNFDAFISFGGTGFSRYDLMKEVLTELGGRIIIDGLNASPGKTFRFGIVGDKPFFVFPGTPQAATLCGEIFLTSWLGAGYEVKKELSESVIATDIFKKSGFYKLVPCFSVIEESRLVSYIRDASTAVGASLKTVVIIPPDVEVVKAGSRVKTFIVC